MQLSSKANLWLTFIAASWGATFPLIKNVISQINPYNFVLIRFVLAALVFMPFVLRSLRITNGQLLINGLVLGIMSSIAEVLQTLSLQYITVSRCAFINGVFVLLVPLFSSLFKLAKLAWLDIFCALLGLAGLYVLTGSDIEQISTGDALVFFAAVFYALGIVWLQKISLKISDYKLLSFYQIVFIIPLPCVFSFVYQPFRLPFTASVISALLFCSVAATVLTLFLQTKYQRYTTASKAALIFMLEPIFASFFDFLFNKELITPSIILGGGIIFLSVVISEGIVFLKNRKCYL